MKLSFGLMFRNDWPWWLPMCGCNSLLFIISERPSDLLALFDLSKQHSWKKESAEKIRSVGRLGTLLNLIYGRKSPSCKRG